MVLEYSNPFMTTSFIQAVLDADTDSDEDTDSDDADSEYDEDIEENEPVNN